MATTNQLASKLKTCSTNTQNILCKTKKQRKPSYAKKNVSAQLPTALHDQDVHPENYYADHAKQLTQNYSLYQAKQDKNDHQLIYTKGHF